jgi:hypothetical protein
MMQPREKNGKQKRNKCSGLCSGSLNQDFRKPFHKWLNWISHNEVSLSPAKDSPQILKLYYWNSAYEFREPLQMWLLPSDSVFGLSFIIFYNQSFHFKSKF